ncbi:hypothetical protein Vretifemale_15274 [Volvox reticuliferus]|uniref:Nudix hydrolase domain-containing protein n=1 Tax=Volvox reticuliferus TaxID=1737510 RepID=A0A8J4CRI0_9CHLO|nr:hypothetical protein Vretifemale_15274 [Volvox reticuliferus]
MNAVISIVVSWNWYNTQVSWQYVERTTRKGDVDAVNIFAILKKKDGNHVVLVVKQYRPPLGKYTIELPAGLVDNNESPKEAALRELKEETGYVGQFVGSTGQQFLSPGLTNENMVTIFAEVRETQRERQEEGGGRRRGRQSGKATEGGGKGDVS